MAERKDVAAALEQGQAPACSVGPAALTESSQVRHHRLRPGRRYLGSELAQGGRVEGRKAPWTRVSVFPGTSAASTSKAFVLTPNGPDTVRVDGKAVVLPKIGKVAMVEELRFPSSIREVTINRTAVISIHQVSGSLVSALRTVWNRHP